MLGGHLRLRQAAWANVFTSTRPEFLETCHLSQDFQGKSCAAGAEPRQISSRFPAG